MKKYLFLATLAALTACSNEEEFSSLSSNEIRLTTSVTPMSRVTSQNLQSTQIQSGQEVGIFSVGAKVDQNNSRWTVDNSGNLSSETPLYWGGGAVTITAYQPWKGDYQADDEYIFNAAMDQSNEFGYLDSDYLWAQATSSETTQAVNLNFRHIMSKINITLTADNSENLSGAKITVCGTRVTALFNPVQGRVRLSDQDPNFYEINAGTTTSEGKVSVIIVPQTVVSGTKFVKIDWNGNTYYYTLSSDKTFASGNSYSYTLRLSESQQEITCVSDNVDDWNNEDISGDVVKDGASEETETIEKIVFDKTRTSLKYSGTLDGDDIKILRQMLGGSEFGDEEKGTLQVLDISEATIVEGGESYYTYTGYNSKEYFTKNNIVGARMFCGCENLTEIKLPDNASVIEEYAVRDCSNLQTVTFPSVLKYIGEEAFRFCEKLKDFTLPESLATLGDAAFEDCHGLVTINIPKNVTSMGYGVFAGGYNTENIFVDEENTAYTSLEGVLYTKDCTVLLQCPVKRTTLTIDSRTKTLAKSSFYNSSILNLEIPEGVETIGEGAFWSARVQSMALPETLKTIEGSGLHYTNLKSIVIPDGVTTLGWGVFDSCWYLEEVTLGSGITEIPGGTFGSTAVKKLHVKSKIPPTLNENWANEGQSESIDFATAELYVPSGSKDAYVASDWGQKYFTTHENIIEE